MVASLSELWMIAACANIAFFFIFIFIDLFYESRVIEIIVGVAPSLIFFISGLILGQEWKGFCFCSMALAIPAGITFIIVRIRYTGDGWLSLLIIVVTAFIMRFCLYEAIVTKEPFVEETTVKVVSLANTVDVNGKRTSTTQEYMVFTPVVEGGVVYMQPLVIPVAKTKIIIVAEDSEQYLLQTKTGQLLHDSIRGPEVTWTENVKTSYILYVWDDTIRKGV